MRISIVIPALNEAACIAATLAPLQAMRARGHEVILVDGGSTDATVAQATPWCDRVLHSEAGRALQMNAGAHIASGEILWFVHADTDVPANGDSLIQHAVQTGAAWGRFDVRLSGAHPLLRVVAWLMNLRSRLTGIATGDQGMFVRRELFNEVGGFAEMPLMEDIALSRALKRRARPACLRARLVTSSRRWECDGIVRTILLMWRLRFAYWRGVSPERLAAQYRHV
ncbi:MAG: TIGR04283 family arsenosugar biosynthesis glycosyltransferase [Gammaproteobacteria bacterium]|nr:TIGR04283 family arsenosugar biosynthesis glycosyltransferase [Gammaproteobacteria bacterium]